jgi:hypothetical protein
MSSLRSRLWLSYAALIVTALSVVAVVLLIYLIRNPLPYRQAFERVRAAEFFDVRVLVYAPDGKVLHDTREGAEAISLPGDGFFKRKLPTTRDSNGRLWLFSRTELSDGNILLVAAPRLKVAGLSLFAD